MSSTCEEEEEEEESGSSDLDDVEVDSVLCEGEREEEEDLCSARSLGSTSCHLPEKEKARVRTRCLDWGKSVREE